MPSQFSLLPGSLALENRPFHWNVAKQVLESFSACTGYLAYKLTSLGRANENDIPSFLIVTKEHGIILLDVVEEEVTGSIERDGVTYWKTSDSRIEPSRDLILEIYAEEVESRIKNDLSLYDRKQRKIKTPVYPLITLCKNADSATAAPGNSPKFHFKAPSPDAVRRVRSLLDKSDKELDQLQAALDLFDKNPELLELMADRLKFNK